MLWLVIIDPMKGLKSATDTSLAVIESGRRNGIDVESGTIDRLFADPVAKILATDGDGVTRRRALQEYDLIFMRKEPPYDLSFHYATQLLSLSGTLVVNSPAALRDYNEKLIALNFSDWMPETLVSSDSGLVVDFLKKHGAGVVKSLDSFQGKAVQKVTEDDVGLFEELTGDGSKPIMVQRFMERVYEGDKRVILLGDKVQGAILRKPKQGFHANFANSDALPTTLTDREQKIVEQVGPWLLERGIHFTGLDLIGEHLTEINITCPTGIVQISHAENRDLAQEIVDYFSRLVQ